MDEGCAWRSSGADIQGSITQFAGKAADWILSVLKTAAVGRPGAGQPRVAAGGDADRRLLPARRLGRHDRHGRQLGAARACRDGARAGPRDQRRHGGLHPRAGHASACCSASSMRSALSLRGAQVRPRHRAPGGRAHLHSLCRRADRRRAGHRRGARPVLAGLLVDRAGRRRSSPRASSSRAISCRPSWSARASGCIRCG